MSAEGAANRESISTIIMNLTSSSSSPRYTVRFLPVFVTVDTGKGWHSQLCPRAIGGINTFHNNDT